MERSSLLSNKKGNMGMMTMAVITILLGSIIVVFGVIMLDSLRDAVADYSVSVGNETLTDVDDTGDSVTGSNDCGFNSVAIDIATNATDGTVITSGNYTISSAGVVTITGNSIFNDTDWNVSYTYLRGDEACDGANSTLLGIQDFADYFDLIVIGVVVTIVIGLIMLGFSGRKVK